MFSQIAEKASFVNYVCTWSSACVKVNNYNKIYIPLDKNL